MNPTKSERKARRSSILKPPKPRQPLQNVDLAASSAENSPTTTTMKIKRRVSFAEKKHVKEFCDSIEQGTVWDNTYEESELSELMTREKSTVSVVTESAITITPSVNTENTKIFADTIISTVERDVHVKTSGIPYPANHSGSFNARRSLAATENVFRSSTNKEKSLFADSSGTCPANASVATALHHSANFVPPPMPNDDCNEVSMDETLIESVLVEPAVPTPLTLSKSEPLLRASFNMIPNIDFSKNDPIFSRRVSSKSRESLIAQDKENINVALDPMALNVGQKTHPKNPERVSVYRESSMKITEAASNRMSIISKPEPMKLGAKESIEKGFLVTEEKTTFQMKTVETVTKILGLSTTDLKELQRSEIDLRPDRMPILHKKSLNADEVVHKASSAQQLHQPPLEKTTIFHDEPVDFTEAVQKIQTTEELQTRNSERTMVFHDTSLEFTEAVQNFQNAEQLQKEVPERTTIFHDESVNRTETQDVSTVGKPQRALRERTTLVPDKSLDFTEVVQSNANKENSRKPSPEKTTIFYNQPVDMTEVVRSRSSCEKPPEEKTTVFDNQPVDMTEVVRSRSSCVKPAEEKTTVFYNHPVDMTEVVRSHSSCEKPPEEKTMVFYNQPVDMTEAVRSRSSCEKSSEEKTMLFYNQPVEMTEVIRSRTGFEKPPLEKTTIFHNVSVDMTEGVRTQPRFDKLPSERTTIFDNVSVDMTEAVRTHPSFENLPSEKTTIFQNQSADTTEVVQSSTSYEKSLPEKETAFDNQSVDTFEVDRAKPAIEKSRISIPERMTILQDKLVDTSEMILSGVNIQNPIEDTIPSLRSQRVSVSHNTSIDLANVEHEKQNEPSESQSQESPEFVSRVPCASTFLSRESCAPAVQQITKQKPLDAEEANRLFASIEMKIADPEVRSPAAKRIKSLGSRKSIDFTAAIPFIAYRKLARKKCNEVNAENSKQHSEDVNVGTSSNPEVLGNKLSDMSEAAVDSSIMGPLGTSPATSVESVPQEARDNSTNFEDYSLQMTEAISRLNSHEPTAQKFTDSQNSTICHDDSMEITRAIPGVLKATDTIFHDQSMELTRAVPHHPTVENLRAANETTAGGVQRRFSTLPNCEGETFFRDDSMELTRGVQFPSQAAEGNRTRGKEAGNPWSKNIAELERDGKTMVFCDDSMEITGAGPFPLQNQKEALNKENDSLAISDLQQRSFRRSESEARIGISKNELLEIMESVPFLSSQKNKENRAEHVEMEELGHETLSEEITGVVPFATQIDEENGDSEGLASGMGFESAKTETAERMRSSSSTKIEKPEIVCDNRHSRLSEMETFLPIETIQTRQSHVAKELFQKPVASERTRVSNKGAAAGSETEDLQAEIRKLAETFALSNTVDESGFDQATFLQQQARCLEDYEANSTASQEYNASSVSARKNAPYAEKRDSPVPGRVNSPEGFTGTEDPGLAIPPITTNWTTSNPNSSVRNSCSEMDRGAYDKSLEELRCRAYSVSKFQPEVTGFELTAAISVADFGKHYESIFEEKPPSFVFSDTITTDSSRIIEGVTSTNELPTESRYSNDRVETPGPTSVETSYVAVPEITETVNLLRKNKSEVEAMGIAEVTMNPKEDADRRLSKNEKTEEQPAIRHRSQTFVIKRPNTDTTLHISSPLEEDTEARNERPSMLTTAAEFTSQTPDGPSEKIRRRESELPVEEIPTAGNEENATEHIGIGHSWGNKDFVNSTAIGDDVTRQFVRENLEDTSIGLTYPLSEDLPEKIGQLDGRTIDSRPGAEKTDDIMEISVPQNPFDALRQTVESLAKRAETIWSINRLDDKILAFNFFSKSIVLAIYLNDDSNATNPIKVIGFLSQLVEEGTDPGTRLAHKLIMKKVDSASLTHSYQTYNDIPRLLDYVSTEVKLGMDFMFELERLRNHTVMDIHDNRITFMARSRDINAGIILKITMKVKPFEEITSNDIAVAHLLGGEKVRQNDIKRLITNVKRDHRFLRFYINDVRDYIDLMAETGFSIGIGAE